MTEFARQELAYFGRFLQSLRFVPGPGQGPREALLALLSEERYSPDLKRLQLEVEDAFRTGSEQEYIDAMAGALGLV